MATFYAVRVGKVPGVYTTWKECEEQVKGFKGAIFKKFNNRKDADDFVDGIDNFKRKTKNNGKKVTGKLNDISKNVDKLYEMQRSKSRVEIDDLVEGEIIAYVDGSFDSSVKQYGYGVVLLTKNTTLTFNGKANHPDLVESRNVAGELLGTVVAIYKAIELGYKRIYVHYDYQGIECWVTGAWKTKTKAAKDYVESIDKVRDYIDIKFIKVTAHSGIKYNEMADKLAREALGIGVRNDG